MSSVYLGISILGFRRGSVVVDMRLHIRESEGTDLDPGRMTAAFRDAVVRQNGTDLDIDVSSGEMTDFDECADPDDHDCPIEAVCVNTVGSFTCRCREGYKDESADSPGRSCIPTGDEFPMVWVAAGSGAVMACIVGAIVLYMCVRKRQTLGQKGDSAGGKTFVTIIII
ncbi:63 kDa sperm flagellar membrane protein-like [Branchiostoma floridae x Branchiostoma japonicum]